MAMMFMPSLVVHQYHIGSTLLGSDGFGVEGSALQQYYHEFMTAYGSKYRTFGHGALHGVITAIFLYYRSSESVLYLKTKVSSTFLFTLAIGLSPWPCWEG